MSSAGSKQVITQLVVDASGAKTGVAEFEAALAKAKAAANDASGALAGGPNSFDNALKKWTQSLASTDPVIRADIRLKQELQRQQELNTRVVQLGIATQDAANVQLDKVRQKYQGYVDDAKGATQANTAFGKGMGFVVEQAAPLIGILSAASIIAFAKSTFENAAALNEQAEAAGVNVEAFQAYRAVMAESGIANDQAGQLIGKLTQNIGAARAQAGPARDAFNQLGIGFRDLASGVETALPKIAQALLAVPDATERARLEMDLFGKTGQKLESALRVLIDPTAQLIEKEKALGQVLGHDVTTAADKAADSLTASFARMKNEATPNITAVYEKLADLLELSNRANEWAKQHGWGAGPDPVAKAGAAPPVGIPSLEGNLLVNGHAPTATPGGGYSTQSETQFLATAKQAADMANLSLTRRAQETATIGLANAKLQDGTAILKDQDGHIVKQVADYAQARQLVGDTAAKHVENLAAITAQGDAWRKVKVTFDGYLGSLSEDARIAGESNAQRKDELAIIKGAQIEQKAQGVEEKNLVQTYDQALTKLDAIQVAKIKARDAAQLTAGFDRESSDQLTLANAAMAAGRDERDLAVQIAQKQLDLGRQLTDVEKDRLKTTQAANDNARLSDYTAQLRDEVSLAGASRDEREKQEAVLQAMRITHGQLTEDQKREISGIVEARQETERWQQLVDGIAGSFQNFFQDVLTKGTASFGDLWKAIEAQFAQMLAYMASQALIAPIIIPMVQAMGYAPGGSVSSMFSGGGIGGVGGSPLGGLGSIFGGGGTGFSLGSIGSYGQGSLSALFGNGAGEALGGGDFIGASGSTMTSVLGGLGPILGGAGVGSLAGSLVFGNKNDASMGSMGGALAGAAIGSIIPGVGTIIGGLIGGLAGGGLGSMTGSSNQGAIANFSADGTSNYLFKQGGGNNGQVATQAATTISDAIKSLQSGGINISLGNISGLSIGSDKSYVYDYAGGKQKLAGGDAAGVVDAILTRILPSATATTSEAQAVLDKYNAQGGINSGNIQQLVTDLGAAQQFVDAINNLSVGKDNLSDGAKAIKQINDQIDPLIKQAQALGQGTANLEAIRSDAIQGLVDDFNSTVAAAIKQANDPVGAQLDALLKSQQSRLQNAQDLGADVSQLDTLNQVEISAFVKGLSADQLHGLSGSITQSAAYQSASSAFQAANDNLVLAQSFSDLGGSVSDLISQANDAAHAAASAAQSWASAHDAVTQASTALLISDQALSPADRYKNAGDIFADLRGKALGGDAASANNLSSFASQFLQSSFAFNASGTAYQGDLSYVQSTLNQLASFTGDQQSIAERQASSAEAAIPILQSIADATKSTGAETVAALNDLKTQFAALKSQIQLVAQQQRS